MPENNNENQEPLNQKCPFCQNELIIKNALLFCPKCGIFIGEPKTFTGSFTNTGSIERETIAREKEREKMKKSRILWQVFIIIFIIGAFVSAYQFKLWNFVFGIDYSPIKEMQTETPFTIYLPKKIPLGYALEKENINPVYDRYGKIGSLNIIYKKMGDGTIEVSLFPIDNGFTSNGKTEQELFRDISNGRDLDKISSGNQDIYIKNSEIILTEEGRTSYTAFAITNYKNILFKIEYNGQSWLDENELKDIADSLATISSL